MNIAKYVLWNVEEKSKVRRVGLWFGGGVGAQRVSVFQHAAGGQRLDVHLKTIWNRMENTHESLWWTSTHAGDEDVRVYANGLGLSEPRKIRWHLWQNGRREKIETTAASPPNEKWMDRTARFVFSNGDMDENMQGNSCHGNTKKHVCGFPMEFSEHERNACCFHLQMNVKELPRSCAT